MSALPQLTSCAWPEWSYQTLAYVFEPLDFRPRSHTPKQREDFIRTQIKNNLGKKLDDGVKQVENAENKKIDQFVDKTLAKERDRSKTASKAQPKEGAQTKTQATKQEFTDNAKEVTQKKKTAKEHFKERSEAKKTRSKGRSRSRTR